MRLVILALLLGLAPLVHAQEVAPQVLPPIVDDVCRECLTPPTRSLLYPVLPGEWRLEADPTLGTSYVRERRHPRPGVWVPGLVVWLGSWAGTTAAALIVDGNPFAAIPFLGAFGSGIFAGLDGDVGRALGYTVGGLAQVAGLVTFIVGLAGEKRLERMPVQVVPLSFRDGAGAGMSFRF